MLSSRYLKVLGLILTLHLLAACSAPSDSGTDLQHTYTEPGNCEVSGKSFGIVGGDILGAGNDLSSSTVMVVHINRNDEVITCTGTLIDSNKVLSAAHCITADGKRTGIAFTNSATCLTQAPKRTLRLVTAEAVHPDYSYETRSFRNASTDLAVLKFKGDIPEGYKVRELPSSSLRVLPNDTLVMTGYGTTVERGEDSGTLRFTTVPATRLLVDFYVALAKQRFSIPGTWTVEQGPQGVCTGDSGGPLYVKNGGQLTLIGVTSMGLDHRTTEEGKARTCHGVALFTDLRGQLDWIYQQKQSL